MSFLSEQKFRFVSMSEPGDTFSVVRFTGSEGLNRLFQFHIDLVSAQDDIDLTSVLENPATFTIMRQHGDVPFSGILKHFEQQRKVNDAVFYHAVLVPKLWWLTLTHHNQVFLDKTTPQILQAVLEDGGLLASDFEFKLQKSYPVREYVCQYNETHYDFFLRWLERDGLYFFFDQSSSRTKLVVTDTRVSHTTMPHGQEVEYVPPQGLEQTHLDEVVRSFSLRQHMLPKTVRVKDYNYRTPSLDMQGEADVVDYGRGDFYHYGDHFLTVSEGDDLARVRAQSYTCRERLFLGESSVPYLRPGFVFSLKQHYRQDFNQDYLTVDIEHSGSQSRYLVAGLDQESLEGEDELHYANTFTAIPASVQFRAPVQTVKPRITGTLNAWVDAAGTGQYASVDEQGRYKIKLPFDLSGRDDGQASAWVRMAQPYGGSDHGMHFPLHKGVEVLLTFIDGDPDRPVIQAAAPNPRSPSVITTADQTMCKITTGGQNKIHIEDQEGSRRILMHSPHQNSFVRIGAHNDPPSSDAGDWLKDKAGDLFGKDGLSLVSEGAFSLKASTSTQIILGMSNKLVLGMYTSFVVGLTNKAAVGRQFELKWGGHWTFTPKWVNLRAAKETASAESNESTLERSEEVAEHEEVVGEQSEMHGERNVVDGELALVVGERNGMYGENNEMHGETSILAGELNFLCGEFTSMIGESTNMVGEETNLVGERTEMVGEETQMVGESTEMVGEKTWLAGEMTILAGSIIML